MFPAANCHNVAGGVFVCPAVGVETKPQMDTDARRQLQLQLEIQLRQELQIQIKIHGRTGATASVVHVWRRRNNFGRGGGGWRLSLVK